MQIQQREREQVPSEAHGDGTSGNLSDSSGENDGGGGVGAGETGGEGEGDSETIRDTDDYVAHDFAGGEMLLLVVIQERGVQFSSHLFHLFTLFPSSKELWIALNSICIYIYMCSKPPTTQTFYNYLYFIMLSPLLFNIFLKYTCNKKKYSRK